MVGPQLSNPPGFRPAHFPAKWLLLTVFRAKVTSDSTALQITARGQPPSPGAHRGCSLSSGEPMGFSITIGEVLKTCGRYLIHLATYWSGHISPPQKLKGGGQSEKEPAEPVKGRRAHAAHGEWAARRQE